MAAGFYIPDLPARHAGRQGGYQLLAGMVESGFGGNERKHYTGNKYPNLGQKTCFSGTAHFTFNPCIKIFVDKIFIQFPVFTLKNYLYIVNCQFKLAVICRILFIFGWLVG